MEFGLESQAQLFQCIINCLGVQLCIFIRRIILLKFLSKQELIRSHCIVNKFIDHAQFCLFLSQKLEEELSAHQALLKSVARRGTAPKRQTSSLVDDGEKDPDGELEDLKAKWMEISKQEAERKQQLQASLEYARSQVRKLECFKYFAHLPV